MWPNLQFSEDFVISTEENRCKLPTNCLSVFELFVKLALKDLMFKGTVNWTVNIKLDVQISVRSQTMPKSLLFLLNYDQ